jgi:hypothetical protein
VVRKKPHYKYNDEVLEVEDFCVVKRQLAYPCFMYPTILKQMKQDYFDMSVRLLMNKNEEQILHRYLTIPQDWSKYRDYVVRLWKSFREVDLIR